MLGVVERRHQVLREALEVYLAEAESSGKELNKEMLLEALTYVPPAINRLAFMKGDSPAQWVLGANPATHGLISGDSFNPTVVGDESFQEHMRRRQLAMIYFIKADASARLQRALLRRHVALKHDLYVGQR